MKAKPFQISALKNQIENQFMGALLFGTDSARVRDLALQIKSFILKEEDPFALLTLVPSQLKNTPFLITDEANTASLLQTRRLIWVKEANNLSVEALTHYCEHRQTNAFLLITAENLPKNSALRCEAESLPDFLAIACYPPEGAELNKIIVDFAQKEHFTIAPQAIEYLIQNTNNDTLLLKNELEKIALYNSKKEPITLKEIQNLVGQGTVQVDSFIQNIAFKKVDLALTILPALLHQGEQGVALVRQMGRYFDLLIKGKTQQIQGKSLMVIADTLLKPAQFRLKQPFQEQIRLWSIPQLVKAKHQLIEAEFSLKSNTFSQELILKKLIFNLISSTILK